MKVSALELDERNRNKLVLPSIVRVPIGVQAKHAEHYRRILVKEVVGSGRRRKASTKCARFVVSIRVLAHNRCGSGHAAPIRIRGRHPDAMVAEAAEGSGCQKHAGEARRKPRVLHHLCEKSRNVGGGGGGAR